jgi:hypothetical protein
MKVTWAKLKQWNGVTEAQHATLFPGRRKFTVSNLEYIQAVVSARFGGPEAVASTADLAPTERKALEAWRNRLSRARDGQNELVLPNGDVVWA